MGMEQAAKKRGGGVPAETGPELSFEEAIGRLEAIVSRLEAGDLALDEALALFEEGVRLSRLCTRQLDAAEGRIALLMEGSGGGERAGAEGEAGFRLLPTELEATERE